MTSMRRIRYGKNMPVELTAENFKEYGYVISNG